MLSHQDLKDSISANILGLWMLQLLAWQFSAPWNENIFLDMTTNT